MRKALKEKATRLIVVLVDMRTVNVALRTTIFMLFIASSA